MSYDVETTLIEPCPGVINTGLTRFARYFVSISNLNCAFYIMATNLSFFARPFVSHSSSRRDRSGRQQRRHNGPFLYWDRIATQR